MNAKTWLVLGASLGALAVFAGAFGDHYLPKYHDLIGATAALRSDGRRWWEAATRYHMYHALALLAVAWIVDRRKSMLANGAGLAMFLGTLVFSGCLYAMGLTGIRVLGAVVPFGGVLLIAGWIMFAVSASRFVEREPTQMKSAKSKREAYSDPPEGTLGEATAPSEEPAAESTG